MRVCKVIRVSTCGKCVSCLCLFFFLAFLWISYLFIPSVRSLADTLTVCKTFTEQMTPSDSAHTDREDFIFVNQGKLALNGCVAFFTFTQLNIIPPEAAAYLSLQTERNPAL